MDDYGIFNSEGLIEAGFYGSIPAEDRRQELIVEEDEHPEDIWVSKICPEHEEEEADYCPMCNKDE